ncbi:hypothetical protein [Streptomyces sp. NPDC004065]|uniref:hypothetical protein n=1 Tax=Streptomyces sp. NPDC004065 TaxID=3364689 RepID=UPI0038505FA8
MRVKSLVRNANPVPEATHEGLSARAAGELAALVGSESAVPAAAPRRAPRRGLLVAAVACAAALAVGGVSLLALHDSGGPGSHQAGGPGTGPGGNAMADEPYYGRTAALEGAANVIVRARIGSGRQVSLEGVDTTVASAKVVATAKGAPSGESIEVAYTTPGSGPETTRFTAGHEYVLLLDRGPGGRYVLVNTTQGWYEVRGGAAVAGKDNHVGLSPAVREALGLAAAPGR